jgi:radical S-adenosyl methionine domain-containing protein 2
MLSDEQAMRGLRMLKEAGMRKLNVAGGEPFLNSKFLPKILRYCKEDLGVESISIVSNGSLIKSEWMKANCQWLDILAISCDSSNAETNKLIGRGNDGKNADRLFEIADTCKEYGVKFKLNTVVNIYNWYEDLVANIEKLAPFRWKVFQCLIVAGENDDETRKRDARKFWLPMNNGERSAIDTSTFLVTFLRTITPGPAVTSRSTSTCASWTRAKV